MGRGVDRQRKRQVPLTIRFRLSLDSMSKTLDKTSQISEDILVLFYWYVLILPIKMYIILITFKVVT